MQNLIARPARTPLLPAGALVAGLAATLVAQFLLDSLADTGEFMHWTQHAILFVGGLLAGAGALGLARR